MALKLVRELFLFCRPKRKHLFGPFALEPNSSPWQLLAGARFFDSQHLLAVQVVPKIRDKIKRIKWKLEIYFNPFVIYIFIPDVFVMLLPLEKAFFLRFLGHIFSFPDVVHDQKS